MKQTVGNIIIEQSDDTIMIRDAKTQDLLKAKVFRPQEVDQKYKDLVKSYQDRLAGKSK